MSARRAISVTFIVAGLLLALGTWVLIWFTTGGPGVSHRWLPIDTRLLIVAFVLALSGFLWIRKIANDIGKN